MYSILLPSGFEPTTCRLDEEGSLLARTAAYTLLHFVYEHVVAEDIKSRVLGPAGGDQVSLSMFAPRCMHHSHGALQARFVLLSCLLRTGTSISSVSVR